MIGPGERIEEGAATLGVVRMESFSLDGDRTARNPGAFPRFVDSLAPYFREVQVAAPVVPAGRIPAGGETFRAPNVRFLPLPDLDGLRRCYLGAGAALARLGGRAREWDLLNLRVPDNFFPFASGLARARRIPFYVSLVGDPGSSRSARVAELGRARGALARLHGRLQDGAFRRGLAGAFCVAHGEELRRFALAAGAHARSLPSASLWEREILREPPPVGPGHRLITVGRISPEKGLGVLLEAIRRARRSDFVLTLVGWPSKDHDRFLLEAARREGLAGRLRLLGYIPLGPDLLRIYREHDLFVLPSLTEGTPRVIGEAMGNGISVLASDTGGIRDLVRHDRTGWLVPPGDAGAMARALDDLSGDPERRRRLAAEGLRAARDRTLERQARRHFDLLRDAWPLLASGERPAERARAEVAGAPR